MHVLTFTQKEGANEVATLHYLVEVLTLESQMSRCRGKRLQSGSGISRLTAFFLFTVSKGDMVSLFSYFYFSVCFFFFLPQTESVIHTE